MYLRTLPTSNLQSGISFKIFIQGFIQNMLEVALHHLRAQGETVVSAYPGILATNAGYISLVPPKCSRT